MYLAECVTWLSLSATSDMKLSLNVSQCENLHKNLSLTATFLGYKSQGPGQWLWLGFGFLKTQAGPKPIPGQRSGPAWLGLAWPGFWPQAGAGTSLLHPMLQQTKTYEKDEIVLEMDEQMRIVTFIRKSPYS